MQKFHLKKQLIESYEARLKEYEDTKRTGQNIIFDVIG